MVLNVKIVHMSTKKQRSIVFTAPQYDFLEREAARLDVTISELIRRIIDEFRERAPKETSPPK